MMRSRALLLASTAPLLALPAHAAPCSDQALSLLAAGRRARSIVQHADRLIDEQRTTGEMAHAMGADHASGFGLSLMADTLQDLDTCTRAGDLNLSLDEYGLAFVVRAADGDRFSVDFIAMGHQIGLSRTVVRTIVDDETGEMVDRRSAEPVLGGARSYVGVRAAVGPWLRLSAGLIGDSGIVDAADQPDIVDAVETPSDRRAHVGLAVPLLDAGFDLLLSPEDRAAETIIARYTPLLGDDLRGDFALGWHRDESLAVMRGRVEKGVGDVHRGGRARVAGFVNGETTGSALRSIGAELGFVGDIGRYEGTHGIGFGAHVTLGYSGGDAVRAQNDGAGLFGGTGAVEAWWALDFDLTVSLDYGVGYNDPDVLEIYPAGGGRIHGELVFNVHYAAW